MALILNSELKIFFSFSCRISETPPYESSSASQSPSRPAVGGGEKEGSKSPEGRNTGQGGGTGGDSSEVDLESLESGLGGRIGKGGADLSEDSGGRNLDVEGGGATTGGPSGHRGAGGKRKLSMGECRAVLKLACYILFTTLVGKQI